MAFKLLRLECLTDSNDSILSARIKKYDGKIFQTGSSSFSRPVALPAEGGSGSLPPEGETLVKLVPGEGLESSISQASVEINPANFTDGDYTIYYYDESFDPPKLFDVDQISIFNGDVATQKVPSTTDIAVRVLDARVGSGTLRSTLAKIDEIHAWIKKQPQ